MNEYLTSPVTPIVACVVAAAIIIAIFTKVASNRRRREREARAAERRAELRVAAEMQAALEQKRSRAIRNLEQTSEKFRRKGAPVSRKSVPAPGRRGFRTDASRDDSAATMFTTGILASDYSSPSSNCDTSSSSSSSSSSDGGSCGGGGGE